MRKEWKKDYLFDDLMIEHLYPGAETCPMSGFGYFYGIPPSVIKSSDRSVKRITGKTRQECDEEMIKAMERGTKN